jgi:hypothetical protein
MKPSGPLQINKQETTMKKLALLSLMLSVAVLSTGLIFAGNRGADDAAKECGKKCLKDHKQCRETILKGNLSNTEKSKALTQCNKAKKECDDACAQKGK